VRARATDVITGTPTGSVAWEGCAARAQAQDYTSRSGLWESVAEKEGAAQGLAGSPLAGITVRARPREWNRETAKTQDPLESGTLLGVALKPQTKTLRRLMEIPIGEEESHGETWRKRGIAGRF